MAYLIQLCGLTPENGSQMRLLFIITACLVAVVYIAEREYYETKEAQPSCIEALLHCYRLKDSPEERSSFDGHAWRYSSLTNELPQPFDGLAVEDYWEGLVHGEVRTELGPAPDSLWQVCWLPDRLRPAMGGSLDARSAAAWNGNVFCDPDV